jgi:two-component system, sporulation sensor kinase B
MDFQYEKILLQMLMVLFPIILFLALGSERWGKRINVSWGIVCTVTMVFSMMVPIRVDEGIFLDLRLVPWFLAFIYGGTRVGISVSIFFFIIRFFIGGLGMIPAFMIIVLCSFVMYFFRKKFKTWSRHLKIFHSALFLMVASAMLPTIGSIILDESVNYIKLISYISFVIENSIMVWFAIYMMESNREKLDLIKEVQKNEKMNVVGQLAASVAHEIRNPMTSVKGFIQLLSTSENISKTELDYLKISLMELDRANDIISDYLSLGKPQGTEPMCELDVGIETAKSVRSLSSFATFYGVHVSLNILDDATILGISGRIQQLFVNIIKNGIEASKNPGTVAVKVFADAENVKVLISDDGEGMDKQHIQNLGLPFYSTKEKGTGLGLMVSLQIIKEMGGKWEVTSEKGKGTNFLLMFPLASNTVTY